MGVNAWTSQALDEIATTVSKYFFLGAQVKIECAVTVIAAAMRRIVRFLCKKWILC
jgi:hypothetical protein